VQHTLLEQLLVHPPQDRLREQLVDRDEHVPHRLLGKMHPVALEDPFLPMQRQVIGVLRGHDMRVDRGLVLRAVDHALGRARRLDRVAVRAGVLLAHVAAHDDPRRHHVAALGDVLPHRAHRFAAVRAGALTLRDVELDGLARKLFWELRAAVPAILRAPRGALGLRLPGHRRKQDLGRGSLTVQVELAGIDPLGAPAEQTQLQDRELVAEDLVLALERKIALRDFRARRLQRAGALTQRRDLAFELRRQHAGFYIGRRSGFRLRFSQKCGQPTRRGKRGVVHRADRCRP